MINRIRAEISLSPFATWNATGVTIDGSLNGTSGSSLSLLDSPIGISIDRNDVLYIGDTFNHRIIVVDLNSTANKYTIGSGFGPGPHQFSYPYNPFVTNGSLYVTDVGNTRVQKLSLNGSNPITVCSSNGSLTLTYLYVDNDENIYVTDLSNHRILLFPSNATSFVIVAGTGINGSNNDQLDNPYGIFVNSVGTIYIADTWNHRIMKWFSGATFGILVAGTGSAGSSSTQINAPTQVILDTNEYMYISEASNARITRWGPNATFGVCIAACTGIFGVAATQLSVPHSLAFDSNGSLYVSDWGNHRVQKFQIREFLRPSYNQPQFSSCTTWNPNATTFLDSTIVGTTPYGIFVDVNNTIYLANYAHSRVQVWPEGAVNPIRNISLGILYPHSVFVTINGDIYVDNSVPNGRVDKWASNANNSITAMYVNTTCYGLFVDISENLYCSMDTLHLVIKKSFNDNANNTTPIAGNGSSGSTSDMLHGPRGIFVDVNFNLYVADCYNDRIQRFGFGQLNAITVAGSGSAIVTTSLLCPTGVVLDADGYLFIADSQYNRIIGSGPSGFQCLIGCTNLASSASNGLQQPWTISFDSYGNLFIVDMMNTRIQKLLLSRESCDQATTSTLSVEPNTDQVTTSTQSYTSSYYGSYSKTCSNSTNIGLHCNISASLCVMLQPCLNDGTCNDTNTTWYGYMCLCMSNFNGINCEFDYRPCKPNTCWNNGMCNETSNTTFVCSCTYGWYGTYCQSKNDYCQNTTCLNNGVCRSLLLNYSCECLGDSYSGRHCEVTTERTTLYKIIAKSFAYVAIIAMGTVAMFVIIMDILKYCFGIDSTRKEKPRKKRKPVIQRFIYVHAPATPVEFDTSIQ